MKEKNEKQHSCPEMYSPEYDPLGMYTGNPADGRKPQQDADDL
jgi:hypothetical protein